MGADFEARVSDLLRRGASVEWPQFDVAELDQMDAATSETVGLMRRVVHAASPDLGELHAFNASQAARLELVIRATLALRGSTACSHLRKSGPQPAFASLPLHRVDCLRCARTLRKPPGDEDDRCDWCGDRGVEVFTAWGFHLGPIFIGGDACDSCVASLRRLTGRDEEVLDT